MTRAATLVLPILALLQNVIAFNMPSRRFMTTFVRMSDVETPVEEGAFSPSGYQVFLGNLPFAMDEGQLEQLVAGKAERYTSSSSPSSSSSSTRNYGFCRVLMHKFYFSIDPP